jgi:hypothetical protein
MVIADAKAVAPAHAETLGAPKVRTASATTAAPMAALQAGQVRGDRRTGIIALTAA